MVYFPSHTSSPFANVAPRAALGGRCWDSRAHSHSRSPVRLSGPVADSRAASETTPLLGTRVEEEVSLEGSNVLGEAEDEKLDAHGHGHGGGMGMDKNTFAQTCANAINILLGIVSTYADLGHISFGPRGRIFISLLFIIELLTASVALVILAADSVEALFPEWDLVRIKAGVGVLVAMTTVGGYEVVELWEFGRCSVLLLITVVLLSGLSTPSPPGSLLYPHPTVRWLVPTNRPGWPWFHVPLSVGLVMAGYSGHATFPNIYRDMVDPTQYPSVVTVTFMVVTILSTILGLAGYIMFGATSMQENLPTVPSFNPAMTRTTVVLIALNPLTKYALTLNPVNISLELLLFPSLPPASSLRALLCLLLCLSTSLLAVTIAIVFPGFHRVMGLLGSLFSFTVSVVFPCACFLALHGGGGHYGKGGGYEVSAAWWGESAVLGVGPLDFLVMAVDRYIG
ncbi:hypothetical protein M427DRAFT_34255 [Gonapodya prolifera JEL478]|uniref:Amino acid transporter transmembrane domain-containing protein n=1 Tax=Gonapodya prolifera (strain JEL478) TaxID=1344416 RepID=A0A139A907_GONPJ|nr:hypothetical protein M427DRAFT_34255 [Gonapodya prolifera JEL478]|eukprot:KXS13217.1 hypothetical protein M427DRAFT_34255 [Gonapodya prolifera JEL478]